MKATVFWQAPEKAGLWNLASVTLRKALEANPRTIAAWADFKKVSGRISAMIPPLRKSRAEAMKKASQALHRPSGFKPAAL